jgi:hypothetical protein
MKGCAAYAAAGTGGPSNSQLGLAKIAFRRSTR